MIPPISLADLLRAYRELQPKDERERQGIAAVLGFSVTKMTSPAQNPAQRKHLENGPVAEPLGPTPAVNLNRQVVLTPLPQLTSSFALSGPVDDLGMTAAWLGATDTFAPEEPDDTFINPATLFEPKWTRAILSTALGIQAPVGRIDLAAIMEEIARARPLRRLPRLPGNKIAPCVQVLRDVGDSMIPFAEDAQLLIPEIERVVGPENVWTLKFRGCPLRGAGTDEDDTWPAYSFPASGSHVLLLTDFGIGRPPLTGVRSSLDEWHAFADGLHLRNVACTAFVPYPAERWPPRLSRLLRLVEWDRKTTAGSVKFTRRPTLR